MHRVPLALFVLAVAIVRGSPESDVRAAVQALGESPGYTWETTARRLESARSQTSRLVLPLPRFPSASRVEVQGRLERATYVEIVVQPLFSAMPVPVRVYLKLPNRAVGFTPLGWLTPDELRTARTRQRDDEVPFEGKSVRLSLVIGAVRQAMDRPTPEVELQGLLADIARFRDENDAIVGELKPAAAEVLLSGPRRRGAAPDPVAGEVIFRLRDGVVTEFEYRLTPLAPPNSATGRPPEARTTHWKTTIRKFGQVQVVPPREAFEKLER